jgi:hypothetical protein
VTQTVFAAVRPRLASAGVLLAIALLPSVGRAEPTASAAPPLEVSMRFQGRASIPGGLAMRFVGYDDRRCPADVACIRQGEARAFFWLEGNGIEAQVLSLPLRGAGTGPQTFVAAAGHQFVLRSLVPVQRLRKAVSPDEYIAVVEVRRTPGTPESRH